MRSIVKKKYINLISDKKFSDILTGSVWALSARVVGVSLTMMISVTVARYYGSDVTGDLAMVQAFMTMICILSVLGTNVSILRLIAEHLTKYSATSAFYVYRKTQFLVASVSLFVGGIFYVSSNLVAQEIFSKPSFSFFIALSSACVVFRALMELNSAATRGLHLLKAFSFMQVLPQLTMMLVLLGMIAFSGRKNDPVYAQLVAWGLTALVGVAIMNRAFRLKLRPLDIVSPVPIRQILSISTPMMLTISMSFIIGQTGVLILGMHHPTSEVGYYAIAVKLATLTSFFLQAINTMAAPKFSELFHAGKIDELFYVAKKSAKLIFWVTTPILLFLVVLGRPVLLLFGNDFIAAYTAMLVLVLGQFVNTFSGSTSYFMNMTGSQTVFRNIMVFAAVINLALNFALIPRFGINGAAVSATVSIILWNLSVLLFIRKKYGRSIGYLPFMT